MNIQLIDLQRQYQTIEEEADKKVLDVLHSAKFIMGENVKGLEKELGEFLGVKEVITCANGTDALVLALKALGIGKGDEVITTTYTFFATAEAIAFVGARPVFVDVELDSYNIDPMKIEEAITEKTKAILPVHIFGQAAKMDQIMEIAKRHGLYVVEDVAQAIGATYKGKMVGSFGDLATFSFFPTKNLGGAGDGGCIATNNQDLAAIVKALRVHGSGSAGEHAYNLLNNIEEKAEEDSGDATIYNPRKYYNYLIGHNSRTDEIQAALLRVKLKKLKAWNQRRGQIAEIYNKALENTDLVRPKVSDGVGHIYHLYILQSERREELVNHLKEKGIATGVYYPVPMHLQKVFKDLGYKEGDFPNSEYLSHRTFAIPVFPELTEEEIEYIIKSLMEF